LPLLGQWYKQARQHQTQQQTQRSDRHPLPVLPTRRLQRHPTLSSPSKCRLWPLGMQRCSVEEPARRTSRLKCYLVLPSPSVSELEAQRHVHDPPLTTRYRRNGTTIANVFFSFSSNGQKDCKTIRPLVYSDNDTDAAISRY
jgi:hypothetical protein